MVDEKDDEYTKKLNNRPGMWAIGDASDARQNTNGDDYMEYLT